MEWKNALVIEWMIGVILVAFLAIISLVQEAELVVQTNNGLGTIRNAKVSCEYNLILAVYTSKVILTLVFGGGITFWHKLDNKISVECAKRFPKNNQFPHGWIVLNKKIYSLKCTFLYFALRRIQNMVVQKQQIMIERLNTLIYFNTSSLMYSYTCCDSTAIYRDSEPVIWMRSDTLDWLIKATNNDWTAEYFDKPILMLPVSCSYTCCDSTAIYRDSEPVIWMRMQWHSGLAYLGPFPLAIFAAIFFFWWMWTRK